MQDSVPEACSTLFALMVPSVVQLQDIYAEIELDEHIQTLKRQVRAGDPVKKGFSVADDKLWYQGGVGYSIILSFHSFDTQGKPRQSRRRTFRRFQNSETYSTDLLLDRHATSGPRLCDQLWCLSNSQVFDPITCGLTPTTFDTFPSVARHQYGLHRWSSCFTRG